MVPSAIIAYFEDDLPRLLAEPKGDAFEVERPDVWPLPRRPSADRPLGKTNPKDGEAAEHTTAHIQANRDHVMVEIKAKR
jgi:hypothetical protein